MHFREPTLDEMRRYLAEFSDIDEFDRERAIYWWSADNHGGQGSNLYEALSLSAYRPGHMEHGVNINGPSGECYSALDEKFKSAWEVE